MSATDPDTLSNHAWQLAENGKQAEALAAFEQLCALAPDDAEAWMMRGMLLIELARHDAAGPFLQQALRLDPGYADAHFHLARLCALQNRHTEAAAHGDRASRLDPGFAEAWITQIDAHAQLRDWDAAASASFAALSAPLSDASLRQALARRAEVFSTKSRASARLAKLQPIFVLGVPRSGTSMIAGALHRCGAWVGKTVAGGPSNPEGFYENVAIRETILKPQLHAQQGDPLGVRTLPDLATLTPTPTLRERVLANLVDEGFCDETTWLYKDCKLSLVWPLWQAVFPHARWVIVRRPTDDIVRSCLRTPFMNQHSHDPAFWRSWVSDYDQRLEALKHAGVWWREIDSHAVVNDGLAPLQTLTDALGLHWKPIAVGDFVRPRHWHA